jgi:hypothetical protein
MRGDHRSRLLFVLGIALAASPGVAADPFVRSDVDQSSRLDVSDAVAVLRFLFAGERDLVGCEDAADSDDSGVLDASDAVFLLGALFRGGPAPAAPFPDCGEDPTDDALGCEAYEVCRFAFTFYARSFAADGVFFVIDRSEHMQDSGEVQRAKHEMSRVINELPEDAWLGLVLLDAEAVAFPSSALPARGSQESKNAARLFIRDFTLGLGACPHRALLSALEMAEASDARSKVVIHVSSGRGNCQRADEASYLDQILETVTLVNRGTVHIHTIGVLEISPLGERFLQDLASRNGGTYTRVR